MIIQFHTTPEQDAEIRQRFEAATQSRETKAATPEEFVSFALQEALRQWRIETLAKQLAALAPVAVDYPVAVQQFVAQCQK